MSLVSQSIKNLKGGISQQPDILRFDDQGARQVNAFSSEVEGLQKRPPSVNVRRLYDTGRFGDKPLVHVINRDEVEQYAVVFNGTGFNVFDLKTGIEQQVSAPNGVGYITVPNPRNDLRMVTVADYTFIINKHMTCQVGGNTTPYYYNPAKNALVICSGGQYAKTYRIFINGAEAAAYTTPLGDKIEHASEIDIRHILTKLAESFNAGWFHQTAGCTINVMNGYLWIQAPDSYNIDVVKCEDGYNGKLLSSIVRSAQKTSDLPVYAPPNYVVKITGEAGADQDDFYVRYDEYNEVWKECPAQGIISDLNSWSMPWTIIRKADGVFELNYANWSTRASGDDDTNPWPSFIGQGLTDIFFFRNRLGFLSGENVILSGSGEYFNFFPKSVAVTSDSDPIDVAVSTNRISILKYAVPFSEELLLWADNNQFVLGADGVLSPTSVRLDLTTEFEISDHARPYGIGRGVYFASPRANFTSIRRFYAVQDVTQVKNAEDISAHVPSYVPNGVFSITGSSTENFLTVLTAGAPHKVFMYKFLYLEEQLAQQSWSNWDFGEGNKVLMCYMLGATMYLMIDSPSGIFLEKITFTQNTKDYWDEPYRLYMDRKVEYIIPQGTYNDDTYKTSIYLHQLYGTTPLNGRYYFVFPNGTTLFFDPPTGGWPTTNGLIQFDGNLEGQKFFVGEAYTMEYEFSKFLIKQTDSSGGVATEDIGRLQLRRAWVNYERSGNFKVLVKNQNRTFEYNMTGNRMGTRDFIVGYESLDTGQFKYPVAGNAKAVTVTLQSDTPNPVAIIGGGWEGNYVRRSSGI
ncbi:MAG: hypothetical protein ACRDCE_20335 [Cetobacterium sp.]|uniref:phage nozzle protein n=1 Tax=Cetobacterium sp. TaxID=2071632 RepID=UPI003EE511F6